MWAGCPRPASALAASASPRLPNLFCSVSPSTVPRKFSLILTLVAWLLATGSHWDLVQTFAWGRMIATYSQSMSFSKAVTKTFSSEGLCGICVAVQEAKKQDATANTTPGAPDKSLGKILLVFAPSPAPFIAAPPLSLWSLSDHLTPTSDPAAPPVPPPRALV
jgi:hypothetical protein